MRSSAFLSKSSSLLRLSSRIKQPTAPRSPRLPRKFLLARAGSRVGAGKRLSSTSTTSPQNDSPTTTTPSTTDSEGVPSEALAASGPPEAPPDDPDKPKVRKPRIVTTKDPDPLELPEDLDILWVPEDASARPEALPEDMLPPPHIFQEALNNLYLALHPQTQHGAAYNTTSPESLVEPSLALYCPIEGGEYVIDATVREMARRTGAEVLVLDSVQLAAGEWGQFGRAANALQLPRNPLHYRAQSPSSSAMEPFAMGIEDEGDDTSSLLPPSQMTLAVMASPSSSGGRTILATPRRNSPPSKIKVFFDALINTPSKEDPSSSARGRPRLIYIRDYSTLAASSSIWYPPLLAAVRQRRRGPISRPNSPIINPMAIIFGMTPSLTPSSASTSTSNGFMSMLMNRNNPLLPPNSSQSPAISDKSGWGEDEASEKAREKRLRERLRRWEKGEAGGLLDDIASQAPGQASEGQSNRRPDVILFGGPGGTSSLPALLGAGLSAASSRGQDAESKSAFFRTSILVPETRSKLHEKEARIARRREINELTMRMAVGAVGGTLSSDSPEPLAEAEQQKEAESGDTIIHSNHERMWENWGEKVEYWTAVKQIADYAVGTIMSSQRVTVEKASLERTAVPWVAVSEAWAARNNSEELKKHWLKEAMPSGKRGSEDREELEDDNGVVDEVIERIRNDTELDPHEQRLLPSSMSTSFSQVHLPPHTIDAVRTIVSLPLIHPQAFKQGILKEHGMTGCLLFGPPGTGKTLVVRALAKEAGCRMMVISPSDVMDMYVGEGEKLVKAVFSLARKLSPCVVFLDEIDALFGARMSARESGGAIAHRGVITEFMQEMDGLKTSKDDRVIVIGATNRPFDLDDAVLRRLPRRLLVDLPGRIEREEILKILLRDEALAPDVDLSKLSMLTDTFSGSDLKHLCVAAALDAVKEVAPVPWASAVTPADPKPTIPTAESFSEEPTPAPARVLHDHNFVKALKEITSSSSEVLGSLAELRKWNEEFGEGRQNRKRQQVWGRGNFGFIDKPAPQNNEGRVVLCAPAKTSTSALDLDEVD
ncbi:hypothetical protein AX16_003593 [Volvariella volvacea WC 439]|nr:hypothetical protein AX16_003593 [Volvariella volvacea WC 439]